MELLHKNYSLEVKLDAEKRRIQGYASVFGNVDGSGDIVIPGAFMESLSKRMPKMLYQHNTRMPIGVWDVAREDSKGLYVEGPLAKTMQAEEAYELAKMGALGGLSIGYILEERDYDRDGHRLLKKLALYEVSPVTFPDNEAATITGVKSALEGIDFEKLHENKDKIEAALRDAGASKQVAKYVASLVQSPAQRDVGGEKLISTLDKTLKILKG